MSDTLKTLIKDHFGYRNNSLSKVENPTIDEIVKYEVETLHKTDILNYINAKCHSHITTADEALVYIHQHFHNNHIYGIWLTNLHSVLHYYPNDLASKTTVDIYKITPEFMVLSDLDLQGVLFAIPATSDHYFVNEKII